MYYMRIFLLLFFIIGFTPAFAQTADWQTDYEKSELKATPRYNETVKFINRLDALSNEISVGEFGVSPEGRPLLFVVYDKQGFTEPAKIRERGRIILFVQAAIHPGESEGKDAMLQLLRDVAVYGIGKDLFEHVSLLFIPIFNVDGHERFGAYGRINQNGPAEMGWRTTAQNLNLNRDYLKAAAPEMQAWLGLYNKWQPEFFIDTHTSDGADYQYVITYALETGGQMDNDLTNWQNEVYLPQLEKLMDKAGFPLFPYVSFRKWHDPRSGLVSGVASPMFSQGYTAVRNRPGLLVETHMLKPYQLRVKSTREIIESSLKILNSNTIQLSNLIKTADQFAASDAFREEPFALRYQVDMTDSSMVTFKGVAYDKKVSDLTGGDWFVYDNKKPVDYILPLFDKNIPVASTKLPAAYIIPAAWQEVIGKLLLHGVEMYPLEESTLIDCEIYFFKEVDFQKSSYEGRQRLARLGVETKQQTRAFPRGSFVVPMNQRLSRLIAMMLEPEASGSLVEWGYFNIVFEQKEYAETYVMEPLARKMLDSIPGLRETYEAKKNSDKSFAESQWLQLNWFYSQTPWWDEQYMRYPIGRIMQKAAIPTGQLREDQ